MNKLITEQDCQRQKNTKGIISILLMVVVLLSVVRVFVANWLVGSSETLRDLDKKIIVQTQTNRALAENLRERESLAKIENDAKAAGFVPTPKLTFITSEPNMAMRQ